MPKLLAELIGTFCLVFAGTGAIIINDVSNGQVTHVGVAITFGLVVMSMIYAVGDVSGAHLNPAVTIAFWFSWRLPAKNVGPYVAAQCIGAVLASLVLRALFPSHETLGATIPAGVAFAGAMQSFVLELIMTFMLMYTILSVALGPKEKGLMAAIAVGGVIGFEAMFGGPISGASMNPARSLAPALISGNAAALRTVLIYLLAPTLGAIIAVPLWRMTHGGARATVS
jgi:aquaporin Z